MDVGLRGSFFAHGVFDPNVVAFFEVRYEKIGKTDSKTAVRHACRGNERNFFFLEKFVQLLFAFDSTDSLVVIEGGQESERVFEPILAFYVHFHSETFSKGFLVVYFSSMAEERHLETGHGAVVRFLVEEGIGHALVFLRMPTCYGLSEKYKNSGFRFRIPDVRIGC